MRSADLSFETTEERFFNERGFSFKTMVSTYKIHATSIMHYMPNVYTRIEQYLKRYEFQIDAAIL